MNRADKRDMRREKPKKEFDELMLEVRRVTRVTTGGRRMSFRATILVGNRNGKIGVGTAKGPDVAIAVRKATTEAYKKLFQVPLTNADTVPYELTATFKAAQIKLLPASAGTGLKAGSAVRSVLELAGYQNILSKIIGTNNKLNNAIATIHALAKYKHADHFNARRIGANKANAEAQAKTEEKAPKSANKSATETKETKSAPTKKTPAKKVATASAEKKKTTAKKTSKPTTKK